VAGRALTPATRLRLGRPLPHQLPDRTIPDHKAINLWSVDIMVYYAQFPVPIHRLEVRRIVLLTLSPLTLAGPFDLHALATPPAFSLSQDQTLQLNPLRCDPKITLLLDMKVTCSNDYFINRRSSRSDPQIAPWSDPQCCRLEQHTSFSTRFSIRAHLLLIVITLRLSHCNNSGLLS
jgi:hypothetical protein